uniref:Uncharacterized protein n=1 Tax=Spongospora subterranea TaxID=70186 RepID=A0A0H5R4V8_9EUKA|eukprot:CRZ09188.1 hypothetical protein [Spongospora subterranea]
MSRWILVAAVVSVLAVIVSSASDWPTKCQACRFECFECSQFSNPQDGSFFKISVLSSPSEPQQWESFGQCGDVDFLHIDFQKINVESRLTMPSHVGTLRISGVNEYVDGAFSDISKTTTSTLIFEGDMIIDDIPHVPLIWFVKNEEELGAKFGAGDDNVPDGSLIFGVDETVRVNRCIKTIPEKIESLSLDVAEPEQFLALTTGVTSGLSLSLTLPVLPHISFEDEFFQRVASLATVIKLKKAVYFDRHDSYIIGFLKKLAKYKSKDLQIMLYVTHEFADFLRSRSNQIQCNAHQQDEGFECGFDIKDLPTLDIDTSRISESQTNEQQQGFVYSSGTIDSASGEVLSGSMNIGVEDASVDYAKESGVGKSSRSLEEFTAVFQRDTRCDTPDYPQLSSNSPRQSDHESPAEDFTKIKEFDTAVFEANSQGEFSKDVDKKRSRHYADVIPKREVGKSIATISYSPDKETVTNSESGSAADETTDTTIDIDPISTMGSSGDYDWETEGDTEALSFDSTDSVRFRSFVENPFHMQRPRSKNNYIVDDMLTEDGDFSENLDAAKVSRQPFFQEERGIPSAIDSPTRSERSKANKQRFKDITYNHGSNEVSDRDERGSVTVGKTKQQKRDHEGHRASEQDRTSSYDRDYVSSLPPTSSCISASASDSSVEDDGCDYVDATYVHDSLKDEDGYDDNHSYDGGNAKFESVAPSSRSAPSRCESFCEHPDLIQSGPNSPTQSSNANTDNFGSIQFDHESDIVAARGGTHETDLARDSEDSDDDQDDANHCQDSNSDSAVGQDFGFDRFIGVGNANDEEVTAEPSNGVSGDDPHHVQPDRIPPVVISPTQRDLGNTNQQNDFGAPRAPDQVVTTESVEHGSSWLATLWFIPAILASASLSVVGALAFTIFLAKRQSVTKSRLPLPPVLENPDDPEALWW